MGLHHDCVETPTAAQMGDDRKGKADRGILNEQVHRNYLDKHPYQQFTDEDMAGAKELFAKEMEVVKKGMSHGEVSLDAYTQVWEECLAQVLYLPSQQRYTRANLVNKKDRIDSLKERLETNRQHMTKEAKRAAKIEQKLKILTGGYQARAAALIKQVSDTQDQIEQSRLELSTFAFLKDQETASIPRRVESLTSDVQRQEEREKELQAQFHELNLQLEGLRNGQ